jgi:hypothetical protein
MNKLVDLAGTAIVCLVGSGVICVVLYGCALIACALSGKCQSPLY